jgi:hypothetical protein
VARWSEESREWETLEAAAKKRDEWMWQRRGNLGARKETREISGARKGEFNEHVSLFLTSLVGTAILFVCERRTKIKKLTPVMHTPTHKQFYTARSNYKK